MIDTEFPPRLDYILIIMIIISRLSALMKLLKKLQNDVNIWPCNTLIIYNLCIITNSKIT